jgi:probable F420-dependent oxidoreductase
MALRFGLGFPTSREGQTYAVGYVRPRELAGLARRAEELGYYSVWGNDHLATPRVIRATLDRAANFYEPIVTFASLVNVTERLRFMLSVLVFPMREPVLLAKQIATLDVLSGGRVMLGLGLGGYRDEVEAVRPGLQEANRGAMLDEGLEGLRLLFDQDDASYAGRYIRFRQVDLAPKPVQRPFPILVNANPNNAAGLRRVARLADGWIAASSPPAALTAGRAQLDAALAEQGRQPGAFELHTQIWVSFGRDRAEAETKLERSQHFRRMVAHTEDHSAAEALAHFRAGNLLGTPEEVIEQVRAYQRAGVAHLGVIPVGETMDELRADMELFAERVMPAFAAPRPA